MLSRCYTTKIQNHDILKISHGDIHAIDVVVNVNGRKVLCTGLDIDYDLALAKARSEAAERVAYLCPPVLQDSWRISRSNQDLHNKHINLLVLCDKQANAWVNINDLTWMSSIWGQGQLLASHGFSAHTSKKASQTNARHELFERILNGYLAHNQMLPREFEKDTRHKGCDRYWSFFCDDYQVWHVLCNYNYRVLSGWGAAVCTQHNHAKERALNEAAAMAASMQSYGIRGNGVNSLPMLGMALPNVGLIEHMQVHIDGEERFICQAVLLAD